jgi:large repetitive protein
MKRPSVRSQEPRRICSRPLGRLRAAAALVLVCLMVVLFESCSSSGGEPVTIDITPASSQIDQGQQLIFTATLGNDLFNQGVSWALTGTNCVNNTGALTGTCGTLSSLTANPVTYTAPAGLTASLSVTLTATAVANATATKTAAITVVLPITFAITNTICGSASTQIPCASNGVPYSATVTVTGGVTPLKFTLAPGSGSLPPGLTFNQSGTITGTPSGPVAGQPNPTVFIVQVTDNSTQPVSQTQQYSIFVAPAPTLAITAVSPLRSGFVNYMYGTLISTQGGVKPFKWSLLSGALPPGLALNSGTGQITGVPTAANGSPYTFTVQVSDSTLPNPQVQSKQLAIPIQQPQPLSISPSSLPAGSTATPYSTSLSASGGIPPYTWQVTNGQLPSGLAFAPGTATISGTPVLVTSSSFTVEVTDSEFVPASTSASYTISIGVGSNSNSLISGEYSFLFNGFDSNGQVALVGSLVADGNGNITGGGIDSNRVPAPGGAGVVTGQSLTGSYSLGTDGRGTMEIIATNSLNVTLTTDYNLVLDSSGNIRFFENNSSASDNDTLHTHGAGIMKPANSASFSAGAFNGNYAFVFRGFDLAGSPTVLGGVLHADGIGAITPGTGDYNEAGTFSPALGLSGAFSFDSGTRGAANLTFDLPGKSPYTLNYLFRFVTPEDIFFVASDVTDATHPRLSGEMILQSPTTAFDSSALAGPGVATGTGLNGSNSSVLAGLLTSVPSATAGCTPQVANCVTLAYDENNSGAVAKPSFIGNFQISANGRVVFTNLGPSGGTERVAVAYLTGSSKGFTIGNDRAVTSGLLDEQETGIAFADSSVQGDYTISASFPAETAVNSVIGQVSASGNGSLVGTLDELTPPVTPNLDQSLVASYANITAAGRGTITTNSPIGFPTNLAFYIVSPGSFRAIPLDTTDQHPEVIFFDH